MMKEIARGKINLALRVMNRRSDGFHEVDMVMQSISLADVLTFEPADHFELTSNDTVLSCGKDNLIYKAAVVFRERTGIKPDVKIALDKKIFVAAGLAGGSTDAAAALRGLNRMFDCPLSRKALEEAAAEIGSDVPFCIAGGTQRARGRGEKMEVLPAAPQLWLTLVKPADLAVSTAAVYKAIDSVPNRRQTDVEACVEAIGKHSRRALVEALQNDLEDVTLRKYGILQQMKESLLAAGCEKVLMSGSGPTLFGLAESEKAAEGIKQILSKEYPGAQVETAHTEEEYYG
ncbi:MAG: 4-(cytidine 5'-diphospho)-2-C-methyl-D-erythritol kinase [Acidaminococcus sp.]|nr:4-(cytidine 5'-diphospho)-2-C-methyl-D-erythritol kinase [Acidaminococcus sp.]MCI2099542.1 4-(cytidine 5'-diphospho)-2-C-methyl-D-erythritol kinase [Acidaminococcus sp.]MCI2113627.1 4-(cytidine 5'-diphospho)-2-C-methyl-D-erythritol kinase [Acidaminococcus sp.]MCI2115710.1 4-(cytidine 5'-diphospho)-2-C-methyl-D-erythritol kinase [Acidaminococcus sp.]